MRHLVALSLLLVSVSLGGCKTLSEQIAEDKGRERAALDIAYAKAIAAQMATMSPEEREALKVAQARRLQDSSGSAGVDNSAALITQGSQLLQGQPMAQPQAPLPSRTDCQRFPSGQVSCRSW